MICGKVIYKTRSEAHDSINGQHNDKRPTSSKVKSGYCYFCNDCKGWHISSNEQKRPKKKFSQDHTEQLSISEKFKKYNAFKSGTQNLIIHTRLNFKVK